MFQYSAVLEICVYLKDNTVSFARWNSDTLLERRVYLKDNTVFLSEDARLFFTSSIGWSRKKFCCFPFFSYFLSYKVVRKGNKWHLLGLPFRTSFSGVLMGIPTKM